jgi:hypothetical protein
MVKNEVRVYGLKHQKEKRSMDHFAGGGALPSGACEDATQSETADAADPGRVKTLRGITAPGILRSKKIQKFLLRSALQPN